MTHSYINDRPYLVSNKLTVSDPMLKNNASSNPTTPHKRAIVTNEPNIAVWHGSNKPKVWTQRRLGKATLTHALCMKSVKVALLHSDTQSSWNLSKCHIWSEIIRVTTHSLSSWTISDHNGNDVKTQYRNWTRLLMSDMLVSGVLCPMMLLSNMTNTVASDDI